MTNTQNEIPHPYMIWSRRDKIKAKIGSMLFDMVKDVKPNGGFEFSGLREMCEKYKLHPYTVHRYLGERIEDDMDAGNNKKKLVLSRNEVIATRQIAHLLEQYVKLKEKEKVYIKFLFSAAGKTL